MSCIILCSCYQPCNLNLDEVQLCSSVQVTTKLSHGVHLIVMLFLAYSRVCTKLLAGRTFFDLPFSVKRLLHIFQFVSVSVYSLCVFVYPCISVCISVSVCGVLFYP